MDATGKICREGNAPSDPEALSAWLCASGLEFEIIGLEAGPLSQWLYAEMSAAAIVDCARKMGRPNLSYTIKPRSLR